MTAVQQRRRRPRWVAPVVVLSVVVLLLGGLTWAGEALARSVGTSMAQQALASALDVRDPDDIAVDLGPGLILAQAVTGRLDEVSATTDDVDFSGISGDLALDARGVPLSTDGRVSRLDASVVISAAEAEKLAKTVSSIPIDDVAFSTGGLQVRTHVDVLTLPVPVTVRFAPSAEGGRLVMSPTSATLAGAKIGLQQLWSRFPGIERALRPKLSVCVYQRLPAGVDLDRIRVTASGVRLTATGRDVALSGSGRGSCS